MMTILSEDWGKQFLDGVEQSVETRNNPTESFTKAAEGTGKDGHEFTDQPAWEANKTQRKTYQPATV